MYFYKLEDDTLLNIEHIVEIPADVKNDCNSGYVMIRLYSGSVKHVTTMDAKEIRMVVESHTYY